MSKFQILPETDGTYDDVHKILETSNLDQVVRYIIETTESKTKPPVEIKLVTGHYQPLTDAEVVIIINKTYYDKLSEGSQRDFLHKALCQISLEGEDGKIVLKKADLVDSFFRVKQVGIETVEAAHHELESIKQQMKDEVEAAKQAKEEAQNAKKAAKAEARMSKNNRNPEF